MRISLIDLISALSGALDLVSPAVVGHHRRVAAIATALGRRLNLPPADITDLRLAALLHDVGAFSLKSRLDALVFDTNDLDHAETGWRLLRALPRLERPARLVRWHHTRFDDFGDILDDPRTLLLGNLLNLADRVDVSLRRDRDLDTEARATIRRIGMLRGRTFDPETLRALDDTIAGNDLDPEFWHGAVRDARCTADCLELSLEDGEIPVFSRAFSQVIDFRSRFTATHSRGVAAVAHALAGLEGLPGDIRARVLLAGDLHDLGKLAVPTEILEKPGPSIPARPRSCAATPRSASASSPRFPAWRMWPSSAAATTNGPTDAATPGASRATGSNNPPCSWPPPTSSPPCSKTGPTVRA